MESNRASQTGLIPDVGGTLSPHDLRHLVIAPLVHAGVDVFTVQKLAGHADATTTARYDRRGESAKRQAVKRLELPLAA